MDITGAILLAGIGVVIGFLLGALVFSLRRQASPQSSHREPLLSDTQNDLRIWREGKEKNLVVEIEGASYHRESDLDSEKSQLVASVIRELYDWMGVLPTPVVPSPDPKPESFPPAETQNGEEMRRTSLNPLQIFNRSLQPLEKTGSSQSDKSIVEQIDEILQVKLQDAALDGRGIHLIEGPDQGMIIEIGLRKYTDIDAVPDETIRRLIRYSVAEWENQMGD
jgi:hypothetical protein